MGIVERGIATLESIIERLGRGRDDLHGSLRHAVARSNELAEENCRLQDRIDGLERECQDLHDQVGHLRFNGPTLYADEVAVLQEFVLADLVGTFGAGEGVKRRIETIRNLLSRCDGVPYTSAGVARAMAAVVPAAPKEHSDPPPGFAPCTRRWPHDGPCAHPFATGCNCGWDFNYGDTCPHGTKGQGA